MTETALPSVHLINTEQQQFLVDAEVNSPDTTAMLRGIGVEAIDGAFGGVAVYESVSKDGQAEYRYMSLATHSFGDNLNSAAQERLSLGDPKAVHDSLLAAREAAAVTGDSLTVAGEPNSMQTSKPETNPEPKLEVTRSDIAFVHDVSGYIRSAAYGGQNVNQAIAASGFLDRAQSDYQKGKLHDVGLLATAGQIVTATGGDEQASRVIEANPALSDEQRTSLNDVIQTVKRWTYSGIATSEWSTKLLSTASTLIEQFEKRPGLNEAYITTLYAMCAGANFSQDTSIEMTNYMERIRTDK